MSYKYLSNVTLDEALEKYMEHLEKLNLIPGIEEIDVRESLDRITSEAVYARISSPHYNACAVDGIAVLAASTFGATDTTPVELMKEKDFVRVDTGDPLPERFDAVVMIEDVINADNGNIRLISAVAPWQHVRQIGEDICAGEIILPSNTKIEPAAIGALLAGGVTSLKVWKKPVAGIIPTGDEIVAPGCNPGKGEIIEFNSSIFSAMLKKWNAEPRIFPITPDRFEIIKEAIKKASDECDLVIVNAGSSAGREDFSSRAISELGTVLVHGIAIRPGKPTILGFVNNKPVIGVPGYPVSGIMVMESIVKKVVEFLKGAGSDTDIRLEAQLSRKLVSSLKYREFVRVKLGNVGGRLIASPLNRGAGVVTSFVKADGILEVPMDSEGYESGSKVEVRLLRSERQINNTLVVIGSHDPLIDIVADIFRRKYPDEFLSSVHVGSMGGIMAVKRSEAHLAGIHLLDESTGEYNISYIKRYLGTDNVAVIKCVRRIQGLMVAKGNPKSIRSLEDICRKDVRYVNRQKGAGTRILLDYLLKKHRINASLINGYEREELTHMSVAALVAAGSADAGMGIFSAAKAYELDFIPISQEEYDFVIPECFLELKVAKHFIEILKCGEFRRVLAKMGGYNAEHAGEILLINQR